MKCLVNGLEVMYPCSHNCPLYGDCVTAFDAVRKSRVRTNADRIRAMSDEELEVFLCGIAATNCCGACMVQEYCYAEHNGFGYWLKQPVKDGDNDG